MSKATNGVCGLVMPISEIDGCSEAHWREVQDILSDAIEETGFEPNLVSHADDVGLIHKRIIQNLYENPLVVCDVSGKNPNVMFELGLRLAFDKPTIIVKDDQTTYSFDTGGIEHLEYPRDLRFSQIMEFKRRLGEKISATYEAFQSDENFTTFLKHFGEFKVAKLNQKEVSVQEFILDELRQIREALASQEKSYNSRLQELAHGKIEICMKRMTDEEVSTGRHNLSSHPSVREASIRPFEDHSHIHADLKDGMFLFGSEIKSLTGRFPKPSKRKVSVARSTPSGSSSAKPSASA